MHFIVGDIICVASPGVSICVATPNPAGFYWVGDSICVASPGDSVCVASLALRGIVGVGPTTLCGEVKFRNSCMWQPVIGVTLIVKSALIGYVRISIMMLVEKEMLNVYLLSIVWYMCIWYVCFVYVYVWWPLQWILRAPPTQDDGPLHAVVSREDDGEFVGFQRSRSCTS